jgi:REP element-mobilizing transposase RayT
LLATPLLWGRFFMHELYNENLFSQRFRIKTTRLQKWDYGDIGYYFVTICTINKINYFGHIKNGKMILSDIGKMAEKYWREIPIHFPHVKLDEYVVMPNHIHGIIQIINKCAHYNGNAYHNGRDEACLVSTTKNIIKQPKPNISPKSGSIPVIIGSYKSTCTREINKLPNQLRYFRWQSRYYDRIIYYENKLNYVRYYIINNPWNWQRDRNKI